MPSMKRNFSLASLVVALCALPASGQLLITQYYEGTSSNKYIELTNVGSETIDMSTYTLTLWSNANSESWKFDGGTPTNFSMLSGTLSAGASYVLANGQAATPLAADQADEISGAINFNGNDSVVLYNGFVGDVADIADAIAITAAEEGANTSIVRKSAAIGFNTNPGSSFLEFGDVWGTLSNEEADAAVAGSDGFLGASDLGMSLPGLSVSVDPVSFSEGAGSGAATGTVTRAGNTDTDLIVNLTVSDETEATVPATVTIPVGLASANFTIDAVDDAEQDASQTVQISVAADGYLNGSTEITVEDDEAAIPTVELTVDMESISENGGTATVTATVSVASAEGYTFDLSSSDTGELTVPATVTIAPDATSATFVATAVDDAIPDGAQSVTVTASDPAAVIVSSDLVISVTDDEDFTVPAVVLNELRIDHTGADVDEYIELYSATPDVALSRLFVVIIGDGPGGSGVVERVFDLGGETMSGNYFLIGSDIMTLATPDLTFPAGASGYLENSDNVSILLVSDFTGAEGDDLDVDEDGMLETKPWATLLDGVALIEEVNADDGAGGFLKPTGTEWDYSMDLGIQGIGPDESGFVPGHVFRNADNDGQFSIGVFDITAEGSNDTPGAENAGGVIVSPQSPEIIDIVINYSTGEGVLTVKNLGTAVYKLQTSTDLGVTDPWSDLGFIEGDNGEFVNFIFVDQEARTAPRIFYRILEE